MASDQNCNDVVDFETVRQESLRVFEVEFLDGTRESVFAHFHDAGGSAPLVCFITIDPNGNQVIARAINVRIMRGMRELTAADHGTYEARRNLAKFVERDVQQHGAAAVKGGPRKGVM